MPLVVPEDGVEVAQRVVVHVFGDPVAHGAVESGELPAVLLVADTAGGGAGALSRVGGGAIRLLDADVSGGLDGGGAVERETCRGETLV